MNDFYGYIRVSTVKQGQQGVSLQEQRDAIERHANALGLNIVDWFEEKETAAKRGRPTFNKMMKLLNEGKAAGVIIHKIDRSARNLKDWADLGEMIDAGVRVLFSNESLDLSSRGGRLSADIQAVVAADYIRNLREETKKGLWGRLKQGITPWSAPIGYLDQGKGKAKTIDPAKGPLVRKAFELYATMEYDLKGLRKKMIALGLQNSRGGKPSLNGINKMLRNPFYIGIIRVYTTNETFNGIHEPLVSTALFDRVQAVLDGRLSARTLKHDYTFKRFLKCKHCGLSLIGEKQKGHVYYRCHTTRCPTTSVREDVINRNIQIDLSLMEFETDEFEEIKEALDELSGNIVEEREAVVASLVMNKAKLDEKFNRLTDAMLDGLIDNDVFKERRASLLKEAKAIEESLVKARGSSDEPLGYAGKFLEQAKTLKTGYILADPYEKRRFLNEATSNRLVSGKNVEIQWIPPYELLAERQNLDCCDHLRDRPRTFKRLAKQLVTHFYTNVPEVPKRLQ